MHYKRLLFLFVILCTFCVIAAVAAELLLILGFKLYPPR